VTADTVLISTGASPRHLGVPGEEQLANRGVSYCATCDGFFFRGKRVVVVGGGNSALDEGLFLTRYVNELVIVHRRDELRADPVLQERAFSNPKVRFIWDSTVSEILGAENVAGVRITNLKTGAETTLETDGVFPYIGHIPNTAIFKGQIDLDEAGYILADDRTRTNVPGVFAAGDVVDHVYRQAITAAGDGCKAAMEATWFLADEEHTAKKNQAKTEEVVSPALAPW
jgi:thioredoxin reductase (NADPH)